MFIIKVVLEYLNKIMTGKGKFVMNTSIDKYIPKDKRISTLILLIIDIIIIHFSSYMGLLVRFDLNWTKIPAQYLSAVRNYIWVYVFITIIIFFLLRLYSTIWRTAGIREVWNIVIACMLATLLQIAGMTLLEHRVPRSFFIICFTVLTSSEVVMRLSYRIWLALRPSYHNKETKRILIVGAGSSGSIILKELKTSNRAVGKVICFVDDDKNKIGKYMNDIPIEGNRDKIPELINKYSITDIYIAIPSASARERKEIIEICRTTNCQIKILPGLYQLINGEVNVSKLREVQIEDLLGREPIQVNLDEILGYVRDKVILVTGGGGSIGSELCRQLATHHPKMLVIFDIYENNVYDLQIELHKEHPELNLIVLIGSVRNTHRIENVFNRYRPDIVYHAAAHKHVPLMEDSPNEAIKNNVFGTYKTASAAGKFGVERFVLISTDKAVNPTNIMGASKRMCEMIIQMFNRKYKTEFVAVRFGNVLGSSGSVIPLFKKQIESGGPVTVTHPDIIRFFMTIPEAVSLLLQAGAYAKGGEIFILDMGEPVKILDMAKNLIRLSGYEPGVDIQIDFTGLRAGEKLYEEILMSEEGLQDTPNKLIHIGKPIVFDEERFEQQLQNLYKVAYEDTDIIREEVRNIVPTYKPNNCK